MLHNKLKNLPLLPLNLQIQKQMRMKKMKPQLILQMLLNLKAL